MHEIWLPEVALPIGTFAALDATAGPVRDVDWIDRAVLASGWRHLTRAAARPVV